jgi:hypothetical protein
VTTFEIIGFYEKQFCTGGGMSRTNAYDLVIIGGGIAGSSLACSMAKAGARVSLLESVIAFAVKFSALGEWQIRSACPKLCEIAERARYAGSTNIWGRNRLDIATSLQLLSPGLLSTPSTIRAYKLRSCKRLNPLAPRFGAARASVLSARALPRAYLIAPTDRTKKLGLASWSSPKVQREQQTFCIAGVLMENVPLPDDTFHRFTNSALGEVIAWLQNRAASALIFAIGVKRVRDFKVLRISPVC